MYYPYSMHSYYCMEISKNHWTSNLISSIITLTIENTSDHINAKNQCICVGKCAASEYCSKSIEETKGLRVVWKAYVVHSIYFVLYVI